MSLLRFDQQQQIKPISKHAIADFNRIADEIENKYLTELLGVQLGQDVLSNPARYDELLNGSNFQNAAGWSLKHKGLIFCLAYWLYAEWIETGDVKATFSGAVIKNIPESEQAQYGKIKNMQASAREQAEIAWRLTKEYLNNSDIELWKTCKTSVKLHNPKISSIRTV